MHLPRALAQVNRRITNPIQRRWAGRIPAHGILEHVGRRSGKAYRTPVMAFRTDNGFVILIGYGLESDWLRNVIAAGGGGLQHLGKHYQLSQPRVVHKPEGRALLPALLRMLTQLIDAGDVLCVTARTS